MKEAEKEPTAIVPTDASAGVQAPGSAMSGKITINMVIDLDEHTAVVRVTAGAVDIAIAISDTRNPIPLEPGDRAIMDAIAAGLVALGARPRTFYRREAQYALWALAQQVKFGNTYAGPTTRLGAFDVPLALPPVPPGLPAVVGIHVR